MECETFEALALDLLYGELPAERKADADAHAAGCPSCGALSGELASARQVARSLPARVAPPSELDARIALAARLAAEEADVRRHPLRGGALHVAAAVLLVGILGGASFLVGARYGKRQALWPDEHLSGETSFPGPAPRVGPRPIDVSDRPGWTPPRGAPGDPPPRDPQAEYRRRMREALPAHRRELLGAARAVLAKGDPEHALTMFENMDEVTPLVALEARLGRAECLEALGRRAEARDEVRSVRDELERENPDEPEVRRLAEAVKGLLLRLENVR